MKTIEQINKEIEFEEEEYQKALDNDKTGSRQITNIKRLREIKLYLEHNPDKDYLQKTIDRLENKIDKINDLFVVPYWASKDTEEEQRKYHNKIHGVPQLKKQLKNLRYILN